MMRLRGRYTLAIGGLVFGALMVMWIALSLENRSFSYDLERASSNAMTAALQRQVERQGLALATSLADHLVNGLYHFDIRDVENAVEETRQYPSVTAVRVVDSRGVIIHDGTPENAEFGAEIGLQWVEEVLATRRPFVADELETLRVSAPVLAGSHLLGVVVVELSRVDSLGDIEIERSNLAAMIRREWLALAVTGGIAGLLLVLVSMVAATFVARRLALPIGALAMRARAIGRGERGVARAPTRSDELGDLARAFDEMALALQATTVSKEYVDNILQSMAEMLIVTDASGCILTANRAFLEEIGCREAAAQGLDVERFVPGVSATARTRNSPLSVAELEYGSQQYSPDLQLRRPDGSTTPVQVSATPLRESGEAEAGYVYVLQNISERVAASRQIENSLRENEILLKEIHHRVKNNLQIISSMLSLQAARTEDRRARAVFLESESRIRAMALIHEQLYRSRDLARVDIGEYLENLSRQIARYLGRLDIKVEVSCDFHEIAVDVAIPCGLIVNELVTNSIQHAFPDGRSGTVSVWFTASEGHRVLIVSDDGAGIETGLDLDSGTTLGLKLVRALVDQLGGQLEIENNGGATFRATFPASKKKSFEEAVREHTQASTRAA